MADLDWAKEPLGVALALILPSYQSRLPAPTAACPWDQVARLISQRFPTLRVSIQCEGGSCWMEARPSLHEYERVVEALERKETSMALAHARVWDIVLRTSNGTYWPRYEEVVEYYAGRPYRG